MSLTLIRALSVLLCAAVAIMWLLRKYLHTVIEPQPQVSFSPRRGRIMRNRRLHTGHLFLIPLIVLLLGVGVLVAPNAFAAPAGNALSFDGTNDHVTFGDTSMIRGTLTGSPTWQTAANSKLGASSLAFNGTNQYVTFGAAPELNATNFTIETWFYMTGAGAATSTGTGGLATAIPLVSKGRGEAEATGKDVNYFLGIAGNKLAADFEAYSNSQNYPVIGSTTVTTNAWHHAAVTYNGSCWQLYLDGLPDTAGTNCPGVAPDYTSTQHAAIGTAMTSTGGHSRLFRGQNG